MSSLPTVPEKFWDEDFDIKQWEDQKLRKLPTVPANWWEEDFDIKQWEDQKLRPIQTEHFWENTLGIKRWAEFFVDISDGQTQSSAKVILKNRVGRASAFGELYVSDVAISADNILKNVAVKLIATNAAGITPAIQEFKIGQTLGNANIGPKMHYIAVLDDDNGEVSQIFSQLGTSTRLKQNTILVMIIMDLLKGLTKYSFFYELHKSYSKTLREEVLRPLKKKICAKIDRMHKMNYIHNDLHSDNIFISTSDPTKLLTEWDAEPYIIDYGLSQHIDPAKAEQYKKDGNYLDFLPPSLYRHIYGPHLKNKFVGQLTGKKWKNKKQYCVKASWACERAHTGLSQFKECGDTAHILQDDNAGSTNGKFKKCTSFSHSRETCLSEECTWCGLNVGASKCRRNPSRLACFGRQDP
jgi:serine/threonine protein kinase